MKVGDTCEFSHQFTIVDADEHIFKIEYVDSAGKTVELYVPVFIGSLGIQIQRRAFVVPGAHLSSNHPDYLNKHGESYVYNGQKVNVAFDKDFIRNGKYSLVREDGGVECYKVAETDANLKARIKALLGNKFQGKILSGTIIQIYSERTNREIKLLEKVADSIKLKLLRGTVGERLFVVVHDRITHAEYSLPARDITLTNT